MQWAQSIRNRYGFGGILIALACLRCCFAGVLWSDEDYHMAAALHILHGKVPYRDFWYDKPPLAAIYYLAINAIPGALLRIWDAAYILLCCFLAHELARSWWSEREGRVAVCLFAFSTTFYLPSAVIPFAPDALLIAPHLGAVLLARQGRAWAAGAVCGLGFWINVKALFVAVACAVWLVPSLTALCGGFALVAALGAAVLGIAGMVPGYWEQVWVWGFAYAPGAPVTHPFLLAIERVGNWLGFHAALVLSGILAVKVAQHRERVKICLWLAASLAAVCFGNHFAPRYFLQLLPPLTVVGARGVTLAFEKYGTRAGALLTLLLLIPFARFAPRYFKMVSGDTRWADIALDVDSKEVAGRINALARPGNTLFVWGYRPDIYVYTRLTAPGEFWDSQPLTGIAADRHLAAPEAMANDRTMAHLRDEAASRPTFFVDGLGLLNPKLSASMFTQIRAQLADYREVGRTKLSIIYARK